jgi:hypothetical protein
MRRSTLIKAVMAAIVLGAAVPRMAAADDITGVLVDSACYAAVGTKATSADHLKCAITCAQRGQRLAVVTSTGAVYMVIGAFTQSNNAKLISLLNLPVVFTGTLGVRYPDSGATPTLTSTTTDNRRPTSTQDSVITKTVRRGDFQEGDLPNANELTIELLSYKLVNVK